MSVNITNLEYLLNVTGGESSLMEEMINIFIEQSEEYLTEIKILFEEKEWIKLAALAHKAKSSVAMVGLEELKSDLTEFEIKLKAGEDVDSYKNYVDKFISSYNQAVIELNHYLDNN